LHFVPLPFSLMLMSPSVVKSLTTALRNAIPSGLLAALGGLTIRNTDTGMDERYNGSTWQTQTSRDAVLQTITPLPTPFEVDWSKGLVARYTMSAPVTTNIGSFLKPVVGVPMRLILVNPTAGNLNFILAPSTSHKAVGLTVTVNANRRRTLVAIWDGALYDWEVGALKV
jgi:hypothetical protein